jgi:hypothetical protein
MSDLLAAIPGLASHSLPVTAAPVVVAPGYDRKAGLEAVRTMHSAIVAAYHPGSIEWLREHCPDVIQALLAQERIIDALWETDEVDGLDAALDLRERMYLKAFQLFALRPPVVEVQDDLFQGAA